MSQATICNSGGTHPFSFRQSYLVELLGALVDSRRTASHVGIHTASSKKFEYGRGNAWDDLSWLSFFSRLWGWGTVIIIYISKFWLL